MAGNGAAASTLAIGLLAILLVIGVYDVLVAYGLWGGPAVSQLVHRWAVEFPVLPLIVGLLLGHLFWPTRPL